MIEFTWLMKTPRLWYTYVVCLILIIIYTINTVYMSSLLRFPRKHKNLHKDNQELQDDAEFSFFSKEQQKPFEGQILVHLDFKGAPPRISYLLEFIPFLKKLGATGILIEYEDMFPYHDDLEGIAARNAYTLMQIAEITSAAGKHNLTLIPLVPMLGQFEFVLKLERYRGFREAEEHPGVLCSNQEDVYPLLRKMIDQVLQVHSQVRYIHIGCEEPDFMGTCSECQSAMKENNWGAEDIYLSHVKRVAEYISSTYPRVRPIIWGNKLVERNESKILAYKIPDLVDVMLYNSNSDRRTFPKEKDLNSFARIFKNLWVAGAFKGASGNVRMVTNPEFHLKNTKSWLGIISTWKDRVNFKGYALAGWQRSNHFSALCELLPVSIPSLASTLQYLTSATDTDHGKIKDLLKCNDHVPLNVEDISDEALLGRLQCDFPGYKVYHLILFYFNKLQFTRKLQKFTQTGKFSFYNIFNNVTNFQFIKELNEKKYDQHLLEVNLLGKKIKLVLGEVYDEYTVDEWVVLQVLPAQLQLEATVNTIKVLNNFRRPMTASFFLTADRILDESERVTKTNKKLDNNKELTERRMKNKLFDIEFMKEEIQRSTTGGFGGWNEKSVEYFISNTD